MECSTGSSLLPSFGVDIGVGTQEGKKTLLDVSMSNLANYAMRVSFDQSTDCLTDCFNEYLRVNKFFV